MVTLDEVAVGYGDGAGAAPARPAARHGRPHRALGAERQRQVDLRQAAGRPAGAAGRQLSRAARSCRSAISPSTREELDDGADAVRAHAARALPSARSRRCAPSLARFGLVPDRAETQGRQPVGRREDAAAAGAGHARRAAPADPGRADQPPRHRRARGAGRGAQRFRRRRAAGQPRPASGRAGRRPALAGGRRQVRLRRRPRRLPRASCSSGTVRESRGRRQAARGAARRARRAPPWRRCAGGARAEASWTRCRRAGALEARLADPAPIDARADEVTAAQTPARTIARASEAPRRSGWRRSRRWRRRRRTPGWGLSFRYAPNSPPEVGVQTSGSNA